MDATAQVFRPVEVERGIALLWFAWALQLGGTVVECARERSSVFAVPAIIGTIIGTFVFIWLIKKLRARRNWARITLLCLGILGVLFAKQFLAENLPKISARDAVALLDVVGWIVDMVAVACFFLPGANRWFRPNHTEPA